MLSLYHQLIDTQHSSLSNSLTTIDIALEKVNLRLFSVVH